MPAAKPAPAPAEPPNLQPVGTPPAGGRWTWDAGHQAWVPLPEPAAAPAATATETAAASKE